MDIGDDKHVKSCLLKNSRKAIGEITMKKFCHRANKPIIIILTLLFALTVVACGDTTSQEPPQPTETPEQTAPPPEPTTEPTPEPEPEPELQEPDEVELIVFAAASMTDTLEEIAEIYKDVAPHVTLVFNFDSSGTLKTQIEEGAECDLFISAAQRQMNELEELDSLLGGTRVNILENKVALVSAPGNPKNITDFDSLVDALLGGDILMAMGNSDVPVGQYTISILEYFELNEETLVKSGVITYGSNVKEVTTQVSEASVDVGIVYQTDAFSAGLDILDFATPEMCGQVIYPAAVLANSPNIEESQSFLDFLFTPEAMAVFENVGFSAIS